MRIGIDARLLQETGVGRYIRNLLIHLQQIDKVNEYILLIRPEQEKLVRSLITNKKFQYSCVNIPWHSLKEQLQFGTILNSYNFDLVHFPYFSLPVTYRKPFVVTIHDLIIHDFATGNASTLPLPLYAVKRLGFTRVFNHALKRSSAIIVPLDCVKEELEKRFSLKNKKITVTKEGFDEQIANSKPPQMLVKKEVEKGPYFLYVGNAYPHKNIGFLINSFLEYRRQNPEVRLILVGREDYFFNQLRLVTTSSHISFLHNVTDSDLGYLYTWAEGFVSASLMEGFGLPSLEAVAFGTPTLLAKIPAFEEVTGDYSTYFDPTNTVSLIAGFKKIVSLSQKDRKALQKKGKILVAGFSWRKMAEETKAVYETALEGKR